MSFHYNNSYLENYPANDEFIENYDKNFTIPSSNSQKGKIIDIAMQELDNVNRFLLNYE